MRESFSLSSAPGASHRQFYLAPMAELSHRALRELIEEFGGCDAYFTEMISASALLAGGPLEKWYTDTAPNPEKCVFQLVGSDIDDMSRAAAALNKLECAGIDINMGCSAPLIRKTGAGAAWMGSIDRAGELISRVRAQVQRRLSVKLRIGFKDDFDYLVRFCRRLENEGVELITLHPRLVTEKFKRLARWDYVGRLKNELKIPVAGNGDIDSAEALVRRASQEFYHEPHKPHERRIKGEEEEKREKTPICDAVMVGRAAVKMPWIFAEARKFEEFTQRHKEHKEHEGRGEEGRACGKGASHHNIEEIGLRFLELLAKHQPPEFHISRARRFFGFFCDNLKWGTYLKNQLNREETLAGIEKVWKQHFAGN